MNNTITRDRKEQHRIELVLDFCEELSRRMILSGANIERVQLAIASICHAYRLTDVSVYLLTNYISLSARDEDGRYVSRSCSIPPAGIHLQRLRQLNKLSYAVARQKPLPERLKKMLEEAQAVPEYPDWLVLIAQIAAMLCLCLMFGGGPRELLPVAALTAALHYLLILLARPGLNQVVTNALTMFVTTVVAVLLMKSGLSDNGPVILITISMLVIPGIPLVNAVRNLLCGNEMNGIFQLLKVTIETMALGVGVYLALWLFGLRDGMSAAVVSSITSPWILLPLSFLASVSFGLVFRIAPKDLWLAGLGGTLTRIVLILLSQVIAARIVYIGLAALVAGLFGELIATVRKDPSTYFIYPAIVPLIPGDLFYYTLVGIYLTDQSMIATNALNCLLSLVGMSIGFVISSIIAMYIRKNRHFRLVRSGK